MQIHRRAAVAAPIAGALALAPAARALARRPDPGAPPNILWVITDDQPRGTLEHMPGVSTELLRRGSHYPEGYSAVPLCGPARASMLTGLYVHNHGCETNDTHPEFLRRGWDHDTVATRLQAAGYRTGYFGKYMNGHHEDPHYVAPGWNRWVAILSGSRHEMCMDGRTRTVKRHVDEFTAGHLRDWLRKRANVPWFAVFAPTNPHSNWVGEYEASPEHTHDFDGVAWNPPAFNERDMRDKPSWLHGLPFRSREESRLAWEGKLEELQDVDDQVRSAIRVLRKTGQLGRTYIIFVSDNGYLLGQHRLFRKDQPYEESVGIPFAARGPGVPRGVAPDHLVSQVDLLPTTLAIAGLDPSAGRPLDGRSMLGHWRSGDWSGWRRRLLVEHPMKQWAMLRDRETVLIDHYQAGEQELYDLRDDPAQMTSRHATTDTSEMTRRLTAMRHATGPALRALEE